MSREALVLLVCCCDFRDGAERLISSKSLRNAVIRAFPGLFRILRMCAPRRAAAVVRPRGREKSADRRRRILISRLLIIRASVPRRKSPFPAYFKGFPAVSPLIPPYPAFLKYPVSPQRKRGIKPENSKTVNQWGLRGRIPVDPLKPQYIWDNYYDVPQTIYYLEENTREMTEEEKADFRADRKVFSQRYVKLIADERERLRKKARETE